MKKNKESNKIPNYIDIKFNNLIKYLNVISFEDLKKDIKHNFNYLKENNKGNYNAITNYYNRFKMWGLIDLDNDILELIDNNANALVNHKEDFEWLYSNLNDYRSKKILTSILYYWLTIDFHHIEDLIDKTYSQYFDLDIIKCNKDEVFVDIGAYDGQTAIQFAEIFGKDNYKSIYCYDIVPINIEKTNLNIENANLKNVFVCEKGVSDSAGSLFFTTGEFTSTSKLSQNGEVEIKTVTIDDDIDESVTFIKMDIEGGEEQALLGCRNKIIENHPKLAISVYHNNNHLWKIARIIHEYDSTYKFYLRYYGNPLLPTEYILYAR